MYPLFAKTRETKCNHKAKYTEFVDNKGFLQTTYYIILLDFCLKRMFLTKNKKSTNDFQRYGQEKKKSFSVVFSVLMMQNCNNFKAIRKKRIL